MKKLAELTTTEFVDLLASDAPAPGGGSAAACIQPALRRGERLRGPGL